MTMFARRKNIKISLGWCVLAAMLLGLAVGRVYRPHCIDAVMCLALFLMLYPPMLEVDFAGVKEVFTKPWLVVATLFLNFLVSPVLIFWLHLFVTCTFRWPGDHGTALRRGPTEFWLTERHTGGYAPQGLKSFSIKVTSALPSSGCRGLSGAFFFEGTVPGKEFSGQKAPKWQKQSIFPVNCLFINMTTVSLCSWVVRTHDRHRRTFHLRRDNG